MQVGSLTWVETSTRVIIDFLAPAIEPAGLFDDISSHAPAARSLRGESTGVSLPFGFPFAGRTWTRVHANTNGNVSFTAPETTHWEQRDPWSNGTMRSVAAAVDSRSAAGLEAMIAVLWAIYGEAAISVASSPERVALTWDAVRRDADYEPAGPNAFQVRLYPSGAIEFAYRQVSERDGIVGLFHGSDARGPDAEHSRRRRRRCRERNRGYHLRRARRQRQHGGRLDDHGRGHPGARIDRLSRVPDLS